MKQSDYPIQSEFLTRTSSRAFSEERLKEEELMSLFEAARWAPSSYNNQPWRFIYARRGESEWTPLFSVLIEFNQKWVSKADTLVLILTRKNFEHNNKPAPTAPFDTGAAWMSLALEAAHRNIVAHGMQGFDYEGIRKKLAIPDTYDVEAMVAIGRAGSPDSLPEDLRQKEIPSTRKPLKELIAKGHFAFS